MHVTTVVLSHVFVKKAFVLEDCSSTAGSTFHLLFDTKLHCIVAIPQNNSTPSFTTGRCSHTKL